MDVLVVESELGTADGAVEALERAGHRVHRCHRAGAPAFPCAGLTSAGCPLECGPIDVAVTVRFLPSRRPTLLEDGITCALRHRVPVVVAGRTPVHPFDDFDARTTAGFDVVRACEHAVRTLPAHDEAARRALDATLARAEVDSERAAVSVGRVGGGLRVRLDLPTGIPATVAPMASVRIVAALRKFDPAAAGIDVELAGDE